MNKEKEQNCLNCTKRYPACQDTCPDKSTGTFYRNPDAEYIAYRTQLFSKNASKRLRRKH